MTNIILLPLSGKPLRQRAAYLRFIAPLEERKAPQNFDVKRRQYYANANVETEAEMLRARDLWDGAYQAMQGRPV